MTNNKNETNIPGIQEQVGISVQDLQGVLSIIDTASQRGAFKANELMVVGSIYNKITTFVAAAASAQNQPSSAVDAVENEELIATHNRVTNEMEGSGEEDVPRVPKNNKE